MTRAVRKMLDITVPGIFRPLSLLRRNARLLFDNTNCTDAVTSVELTSSVLSEFDKVPELSIQYTMRNRVFQTRNKTSPQLNFESLDKILINCAFIIVETEFAYLTPL